ncbi:MAG: recombinase family protein [Desulfovibrionales bacterium]|nr:recombinase family protein [Desulfovibrionales bacterium]
MRKVTQYVAYLRVSTKRQKDKGLSFSAQRKIIEETVQMLGGRVVKWYEEQESATERGVLNRIIQREALEYCKEIGATFTCALVDRFCRDVVFAKEFLDTGLPYLFCDAIGATRGEVMKKAMEAQLEAEKNSKRTIDGLAQAKAKGVKLGIARNLNKDAWDKSVKVRKIKALTNPNNRKAVNLATKFRELGMTYQQICDALNEAEIYSSKGKKWHPSSITRLFDLYKGNEEYKKTL